jgi:hypothetical protein
LSQYFKRFIQIKAQIPNIPDEVVIIATIKGLRVGQCAYHLAREKLSTVAELYEVIQNYCKSDDDYRKRIEEENNFRAQIKQKTTSILQDQTTMSEDHLHHTIKSIKLRMTTIQ